MADTYEQNLAQKSTLTTSDYIRVVGSDNVSYKQPINSVGDIFPTRAEVDALNAETSGTVTFNTTNVTGSNTGKYWDAKGSLVMVNLEFTMLSGKIAHGNVICTGLPAPKRQLYAQTGTLQVSVTTTGDLIVYYPTNTTDLTRHELSLAYIKA